jgi:TfoX/Sxy family transcriptional regulator of competence genes
MRPPPLPERQLTLYDALIATYPGIERRGKSSPYTSVNGNMFSILSTDGTLGLRLADADRDAFTAAYGTGLYQAHGTVMKEYAAIPPELLARTAELAPWLAKSHGYAKSLKPKPTTRRR